jgi:hypothetical protein
MDGTTPPTMAGRRPCCNAVGPLEMLMRESLALGHGSYIVAESTFLRLHTERFHDFPNSLRFN